MNSDLLAVLDYMEREKGIKREVLLDAVSSALLTAAKKSVGPARDLRVSIDPKSGEITAHATLFVVQEVRNIHDEILVSRARKIKPESNVGDLLEIEVTPEGFGRIAAQTARQAILQRIRQAEKEMIYDEFKETSRGNGRGRDRTPVRTIGRRGGSRQIRSDYARPGAGSHRRL